MRQYAPYWIEWSVAFKAPGTGGCLLDFSDFNNSDDTVQLPDCHQLVAGDCVQFEEVNGANLDSGMTEGQCYCITNINDDNEATFEGVSLSNDGGESSVAGTITALTTDNATVTGAAPGSDLTDGQYNNVDLSYHSSNNTQATRRLRHC